MVGMMLWEPSGHWTRPVTLKEVSVLHIRFLCARMAQDRRRNPLTERRRLRTAGKKLLRQRVEQVVLPAGASAEALPEGLRPVETLPLRRAIAADWCGELLRFRGENPAGTRVAVTADALSGEGGGVCRITDGGGGADGDGAGSASPVSHIEGPLRRGGAVPPSAAGIRRVHRAEPGDGAGAGVCPHNLRPHGSAGRRLFAVV